MLAQIEEESSKYNLKLNRKKCHVICMNCNPDEKFANGDKVEHVDSEKYLGGLVTKNMV